MLSRLWMRSKYRRLLRLWCEFRNFVFNFEGSPEVTDAQEQEFLRLQARIAGLLPLLASPRNVSVAAESQRHLASITDLLNRHRSLRSEAVANPRAREEFDQSWHQHFIFLNKLQGVAWAGPRVEGRPPRHPRAPTGVPSWRLTRERPEVRLLLFVVKLGLLVLAIYILGRAFGVRWKEDGGFALQAPGSAGAAGQAARGGLAALWSEAVRFFDPVVAAYGGGVTLFLLGVLVLLIIYWLFLRGR